MCAHFTDFYRAKFCKIFFFCILKCILKTFLCLIYLRLDNPVITNGFNILTLTNKCQKSLWYYGTLTWSGKK